MKKILITLLLWSNSLFSMTTKDSVKLILNESKLSLKHKKLLMAQAVFESGHFKKYKYNNIFGTREKKYKIVKGKRKFIGYGLKHFSSLKVCINTRISLYVEHNYRIRKSYYTDKNYVKKLNNILRTLSY